jgi:hypothetical protein
MLSYSDDAYSNQFIGEALHYIQPIICHIMPIIFLFVILIYLIALLINLSTPLMKDFVARPLPIPNLIVHSTSCDHSCHLRLFPLPAASTAACP